MVYERRQQKAIIPLNRDKEFRTGLLPSPELMEMVENPGVTPSGEH